jgi:hypothetical protein
MSLTGRNLIVITSRDLPVAEEREILHFVQDDMLGDSGFKFQVSGLSEQHHLLRLMLIAGLQRIEINPRSQTRPVKAHGMRSGGHALLY